MEAQLARLSLDFSFVNAVESANLDYEQLLRSRCLSYEVGGRYGSMFISEVACYMSHEQIWRFVKNKKLSYALVCEDDIEFRHPPVDLPALVENLDESCDLLYLGYSRTGYWDTRLDGAEGPMFTCGSYKVYKAGACSGTYCYLISVRGAAKCLARSRPIHHAVDGYLISLVNSGYLSVCALDPAAATHIGKVSTIEF